MKKILTIALSLLLILTAASSLFAAELPEESQDLSVVYTNNCDGLTVPVTEGNASGRLPDGTEFTAENLPENAVTFRVYPVQPDEKDVKKWVEDNLAKELDAVVTYYVACADADGKELSNNGVKVTVAAPDTDEAVTVHSLDSSGKIQSLNAESKEGKITFTATGAQLYPFAVTVKNPGTSDRQAVLFVTLLAFAAFVTTALIVRKCKKIS